MHLLELNYDVLSEIISSTQRSELSNFVRTCHLAHDLAMPYLVSSVHLHRDHQQVLNFCQFMLSDPSRWIPMLRVLRILHFRDDACIDNNDSTSKICNNDPQTQKHPVSLQVLMGSRLADVLKHACNLSCLRLDDIEQLLEYAPQICGAIIFCPKLTTVHFSDMGQRSRDMMVNMLGLRHIDIHHDGDVTTLLRPFQSTLEEVSCMSPHVEHQSIEFDETYQWPRVHTLHLGNHSKNKIIKQKLVRAFPNLQTLLLVQRPTDHSTRALNEGSECWPRLDYVQGSLVDLYNLAFSCPIRELNVRGVVYSPNQPNNSSAEMFLDLVRATQPQVLSFSVSEALLDTSFYEQFSRFVPRLEFLELSLIYGSATFLQQLVRTITCCFSVNYNVLISCVWVVGLRSALPGRCSDRLPLPPSPLYKPICGFLCVRTNESC
jgi:hypothetical protein